MMKSFFCMPSDDMPVSKASGRFIRDRRKAK